MMDYKYLYKKKESGIHTIIAAALIGGTILATHTMIYRTDIRHEVKTDCMTCHKKQAYTAYFKGMNSTTPPDKLAEAVLATKSPRLLSAMAKVETQGRNVTGGYKKKYHGEWQVGRHWGKTSHDVTERALQAELALDTHVTEQKQDIVKGLNAYGGESNLKKGKYAYKVLAELVEVP